MHVLLIYANRPRLTYGFMPGPYGLETLRAHARAPGVDFDIVNPFLSLDPEAAVRRAIRDDTLLIGVSIRNLDDALVLWSLSATAGQLQTESCIGDIADVLAFCRRSAPGVRVVLGGAAFAHMPAQLLEHLGADVGFSGASEDDFARLVGELLGGERAFDRAARGLPAMVERRPGRRALSTAPGGRPPAARRVPVLEREEVYFRFRPEAAVRTYAGCPLACAHCMEHVSTRWAERSPVEVVADEVAGVVARYPTVKRIFFADSEVNLAGEERTAALLRAIRARADARAVPLVGYFNPHPMSSGLLDHLWSSGCEVRLTVDHTADAVLSRNGKNFRSHHLRTIVSHYAAAGRELSFCLLLGQPGETRQTVDEVLRFVNAIPDTIRGPIYFSPGVRVYPGTPIERDLAAGRLDARWVVGRPPGESGSIHPAVYCESWRPRELFEYVVSRSGGRMQPMNGYLASLDAEAKASMDREFERYHIGAASKDTDDDACLEAWSAVGADAPFLSPTQRADLLWTRGLLALQKGAPGRSIEDWQRLREMLTQRGTLGSTLERVDHNLSVARQVAAADSVSQGAPAF